MEHKRHESLPSDASMVGPGGQLLAQIAPLPKTHCNTHTAVLESSSCLNKYINKEILSIITCFKT